MAVMYAVVFQQARHAHPTSLSSIQKRSRYYVRWRRSSTTSPARSKKAVSTFAPLRWRLATRLFNKQSLVVWCQLSKAELPMMSWLLIKSAKLETPILASHSMGMFSIIIFTLFRMQIHSYYWNLFYVLKCVTTRQNNFFVVGWGQFFLCHDETK